ncbi:hypothetical protein RGQ15_16355 [Paracoccus sp. MBLB3053]|uniref:Uncharacterized protein n=1 Tax=Paracoccus aurantius TaxID=3073814 RepID=A0ABU2HVR6_9RHOB|nr:hypothetical protein [Paracoccus sp. MBLB3053]MDS9469138.1 hypothetical protein [Paracoccus sp. MBLB3053]
MPILILSVMIASGSALAVFCARSSVLEALAVYAGVGSGSVFAIAFAGTLLKRSGSMRSFG